MSFDSFWAMPMKVCKTDEELEELKKRAGNQYDFYYPIGNCPPIDVTHGCHIPTPCDVMLLGCGDIRYLLHTLHVLHERLDLTTRKPILNFHLNDIEDGILARDLIFLYLIDTIDPNNDEDLKFLWAVWYEVILSKDHHARLLEVMKRLEDIRSGDYGVYFGSDWTREKLVLDMKWMEKQKTRALTVIGDRKTFFLESYDKSEFPQKPAMRVSTKFTKQHNIFDDNPDLKNRLVQEILEYVEYGVTKINAGRKRKKEIEREFRGNPTFYRPRSDVWKSQDNCSPFMCYRVDYQLERYDGVSTTISTLMFEKLRTWVMSYQSMKKEGWDVKICLWLGDCMELCEEGLAVSQRFDFIHTSNLSDRIGIVPLLVQCQDRLKRDNGLVTIESYQWTRMMNTVENTLRFSVDIALMLYPSVVGLHLVDDLTLGHERLLESGYFVGCGSLILTWKVARQPSLLTITGSDEVSKCIRAMVRPNTEQKKTAGPWQFQGVEVTKFDISCRTKLVQRLRKYIEGGGRQIAKILSDYLMGSVPESMEFLMEDGMSPEMDDPTPSLEAQRKEHISSSTNFILESSFSTVTEFIDKYEVTVTCDPSQLLGEFSCDYKNGDQHTAMYTFTDSGKVTFQNTISFACPITLGVSSIQFSRKRGVITSTLYKNPAMTMGEKLMPRTVNKQKLVSKLPAFPTSKFGHQFLSTWMFRMYPLNNRPPQTDNIGPDHQLQELIEFLMQTSLEQRKKARVLCFPQFQGRQDTIGKWTAVFHLDGLKIWEGKPSLFVTWYDLELARMLMSQGKIKQQEIEAKIKDVKPDFVLKNIGRYMMGYLSLVKILMVNSLRLEQAGPEDVRWQFRSCVRPRYKHLPLEVYQNEINLSAKYGSFSGDPESVKSAMHRMLNDTGLASKLSEKEVEDIFTKAMKMNLPGYTGYGMKGSSPGDVRPPSGPGSGSQFGAGPGSGVGAASRVGAGVGAGAGSTSSTGSDQGGCDGCGKVSPQCRKCGGCGKVVYCDRECQRKAWPRHKLICKK